MENNNKTKCTSALFVPVFGQWIDLAFEYFKKNKKKLYFYTNANIGIRKELLKIYFKRKGEDVICAVADFIEISTVNPRGFRLKGCENDEGKYYYGFKNLKRCPPVKLKELQHNISGKLLRNDAPRPYVIRCWDTKI